MPRAMVSAFPSRGLGGYRGVSRQRACFSMALFACPGACGWELFANIFQLWREGGFHRMVWSWTGLPHEVVCSCASECQAVAAVH